jgi:hypothetical protein
MEMVVQLRLTVYGNGWQAVLPVYGNGCATMSYSLCNYILRFMEMVMQPCLTAYVTASYGLWEWLASSSPRLWKWF